LDTAINRSGGLLPASLETLFLQDFDNDGLRIDELIGMLKKGQLPNLRTIQFAMFYDSDEFDNWETVKDNGWSMILNNCGSMVLSSPVDRCYDPSPMPENEDWPCDCWTYHHQSEKLGTLEELEKWSIECLSSSNGFDKYIVGAGRHERN
jgi:hypothetical protein